MDFDLAICVYVMCNVLSEQEVKETLAEIYKMLKPGGKLNIYESHVLKYMQWDDIPEIPLLYKIGWGTPKEDGTKWGYSEDEGKPREVAMRMDSEQEIKVIPADAPEYAKFAAGKPAEMCWERTKPLSR